MITLLSMLCLSRTSLRSGDIILEEQENFTNELRGVKLVLKKEEIEKFKQYILSLDLNLEKEHIKHVFESSLEDACRVYVSCIVDAYNASNGTDYESVLQYLLDKYTVENLVDIVDKNIGFFKSSVVTNVDTPLQDSIYDVVIDTDDNGDDDIDISNYVGDFVSSSAASNDAIDLVDLSEENDISVNLREEEIEELVKNSSNDLETKEYEDVDLEVALDDLKDSSEDEKEIFDDITNQDIVENLEIEAIEEQQCIIMDESFTGDELNWAINVLVSANLKDSKDLRSAIDSLTKLGSSLEYLSKVVITYVQTHLSEIDDLIGVCQYEKAE